MNEFVKLYKNNPIRIIEIDGAPWFVGKDVCKQLGYADVTNAMKQHCRGVVKRHPIVDSLGRMQEVRILSEPDVMRLICGSKLPSAVKFERWVFEEVLPSIRKTGAYFTPNAAMEMVSELINSIGEQYKRIIDDNRIFREQLEYALQFVPNTKYGSVSPANGQRRTTIRRGANVAGKGRLIEKRNPEEVGYQMDLFGEYLPQIVFNTAVNFISNGDVSKLGNATV